MSQEGKALWAGLILLSPGALSQGYISVMKNYLESGWPQVLVCNTRAGLHPHPNCHSLGVWLSQGCERRLQLLGTAVSPPSSLALLLGAALPYEIAEHEAGMRRGTRAPRRAAAAPGCRVISTLWHNKYSFSLKWLCSKCLRGAHLSAVCALQGRVRADCEIFALI